MLNLLLGFRKRLLLGLVATLYVVIASSELSNDCASQQNGTPCTWSDGRTGTCFAEIYCNECDYSNQEGAPDCTALFGTSSECVWCNILQPYNSWMCVPRNEGSPCTYNSISGTCSATGQCMNSVVNDPIITGFDGNTYHFNELGNHTLLADGSGWKIDVTFSGVEVIEQEREGPKEKSWTTGVRFYDPHGNFVSCSLPGITPNTSHLTAIASSGTAKSPTQLTPSHTTVQLDQMTANAVLSWKEYAGVQYSQVVGCQVSAPAYQVSVYQVSGWEEAQARPEEHGWAAPYTWLNLELTMTAHLEGPVSGILGKTYPKDLPPQKPINQGAPDTSMEHYEGKVGDVVMLGEPHIIPNAGNEDIKESEGSERTLAANPSIASSFIHLTAALGMGGRK